MKKRKAKRRVKKPTARELFAQCAAQLTDLNRRYESLFQYVNAVGVYDTQKLTRETIDVTIQRDMRAGETLHVPIPLKFIVRS